MATLTQKKIPGVVGISTYVDYVYHKEMQQTAVAAAQTSGPINQLRTITVTLDFNLLIENLRSGLRDEAEEQVAMACKALEAAGADFIVVTSGTTSTLVAKAQRRISIPFLDLAEACWKQSQPLNPVGLICTRYAAAGGIFQNAAKRYSAELLLPSPKTAERVDNIIFSELVRGTVSREGLQIFRDAVLEIVSLGAVSVILGNTDLTLIADELQSVGVQLIDAARAHAREAAYAAL